MNEWISVKESDSMLENHTRYIVTDGVIVTTAYYDFSGFVGFEEDIRCVTHYMEFPKPPKE